MGYCFVAKTIFYVWYKNENKQKSKIVEIFKSLNRHYKNFVVSLKGDKFLTVNEICMDEFDIDEFLTKDIDINSFINSNGFYIGFDFTDRNNGDEDIPTDIEFPMDHLRILLRLSKLKLEDIKISIRAIRES